MSLVSAVPLPDPAIRGVRKRMILEGDVPSNVNIPSGCRFHTRCPFATDKCKTESPELKEYEPGHHGACFYPLAT